jgi:hypothetical protein
MEAVFRPEISGFFPDKFRPFPVNYDHLFVNFRWKHLESRRIFSGEFRPFPDE